MSDLTPSSATADVDALLKQVDPEFHASLDALLAVENASDVHIEASVLDPDGEETFDRSPKPEAQTKDRVPLAIRLRTWPREALGYAIAQIRHGTHGFKGLSRARKGLVLGLVAMVALISYLVVRNLRGTWLPRLNAPMLTGFAKFADHVEEIAADAELVSLTAAFPPDVHEFLFKPFKVNLRATAENPQPMGAFEFVVTLDAKETAIEARDREVEMVDLIQRVFEDESVHDLATELGKARLKSRIQREINAHLSQGRVTDVHFKTFVLKP